MRHALPKSYYLWTLGENFRKFPQVSSDQNVKLCIVGGGFAGVNTALSLAEKGWTKSNETVVVESDIIGFGASGRNGGFAFAGFSRDEELLIKEVGAEKAKFLFNGTISGINQIRDRAKKYEIDCDVVDHGVLWVNWFKDQEVLLKRQTLLKETFGVDWKWVNKSEVQKMLKSEQYNDALFEENALHFNPLKYVRGAAAAAESQGVKVFEKSPATKLEKNGNGWKVTTPGGVINAEKVLLASGGYLAGLDRKLDKAMLSVATYVMVTEPLGDKLKSVIDTQAAIYDTRFAFDYYRPLPDGRILWGGRISIFDRSPESVQRVLMRDLLWVYPQLKGIKIDFAWSGMMGYTLHKMPYIGRVQDGLYLCQGFGGHGVASSSFGGELAASSISENRLTDRELIEDYRVGPTYKPGGFGGVQAVYWWLQIRDELKNIKEKILAV